MIYSDPKINNLSGGWYCVRSNGEVITEAEMSWLEIPHKKEIKIVGLKRHNKHLEIEGKENWIPPGETHEKELSVTPSTGNMTTKSTLVGWFIGYFEGQYKHLIRVNAITGEVIKEAIPIS